MSEEHTDTTTAAKVTESGSAAGAIPLATAELTKETVWKCKEAINIAAGSKMTIPIPVAKPNSCFSWDFSTTGGDIEFALTLFPETSDDGDPKAIVLEEKHRCSAHVSAIKGMIAIGEHTTHGGTLVVEWDNRFSWMRSKGLKYLLTLVPPQTEAHSSPTDNQTPSPTDNQTPPPSPDNDSSPSPLENKPPPPLPDNDPQPQTPAPDNKPQPSPQTDTQPPPPSPPPTHSGNEMSAPPEHATVAAQAPAFDSGSPNDNDRLQTEGNLATNATDTPARLNRAKKSPEMFSRRFSLSNIDSPHGELDMGDFSAAVYTAEQQSRFGIDAIGNRKLQSTEARMPERATRDRVEGLGVRVAALKQCLLETRGDVAGVLQAEHQRHAQEIVDLAQFVFSLISNESQLCQGEVEHARRQVEETKAECRQLEQQLTAARSQQQDLVTLRAQNRALSERLERVTAARTQQTAQSRDEARKAAQRIAKLEAELQECSRARRLDGQQQRHEVLMLKQQHDYTVESLKKQIRKLEESKSQRSKQPTPSTQNFSIPRRATSPPPSPPRRKPLPSLSPAPSPPRMKAQARPPQTKAQQSPPRTKPNPFTSRRATNSPLKPTPSIAPASPVIAAPPSAPPPSSSPPSSSPSPMDATARWLAEQEAEDLRVTQELVKSGAELMERVRRAADAARRQRDAFAQTIKNNSKTRANR